MAVLVLATPPSQTSKDWRRGCLWKRSVWEGESYLVKDEMVLIHNVKGKSWIRLGFCGFLFICLGVLGYRFYFYIKPFLKNENLKGIYPSKRCFLCSWLRFIFILIRGVWWAAVHGVTKSRTQLSDFTFTFHFHALEKEMATHSSVLAWRIPGMGEPGGLPSMGSHRVGHDRSDLAAAAAADEIRLKWFAYKK